MPQLGEVEMSADFSRMELVKEIQALGEKRVIREDLAVRLCRTIDELSVRENELNVLMKGSKAVLEHQGFSESSRAIFDYCKGLIGATSGYVALLSETGEENEVLFLDAGGLPCDVDPELPMPIRGLRAEAYHLNKAVFHNDFMNSQWVEFIPNGHVILNNVMFAPLVIGGKTVGIMGLANKPSDFNENDAKMATGFGELAAIALQNSRNMDKRIDAEKQRERVIKDLNDALLEVKRLSGFLPICSHCKKIRNDKGYWDQIETYISRHSEAKFTHGICPDCAQELYPELNLYED